MKYVYRYTPELIVAFCLLAFFMFKTPGLPTDRIISGDGKGYYACLPAAIIYKDFQYKFTENNDYVYYAGTAAASGDFRKTVNGRTVDKFFPGMAIVWLPFFLFGHAMAWLELYPMDGYSPPYQFAIAFAAFFFLWLGAKWLIKLLKRSGAGDCTASLITLLVIAGTNLLYYTVKEPSYPHVYSFALITGFLLLASNLFNEYRPALVAKLMVLLTLIVLIRPVDGLIILLVPFMAGDRESFRDTLRKILAGRMALVRGIIESAVLLMVPVTLWYLQTGHYLVYSYGDERLGFLHPHMLNILFSFNRGWFLYSPIALVSMAGLFHAWRTGRFRALFLAGFLLLYIYVVSCWWMWSYNSHCGQRVFIDIYAVIALLLLFLYQSALLPPVKKWLTALLSLLLALSIFQVYQHSAGVFPSYDISRAVYRDAAFRIYPHAKVFIPGDAISGTRSLQNDMEADLGRLWMNPVTRDNRVFHQGQWSSRVDQKIPYSVGLESRFDSLFTTKNRVIRISASILAPTEVSGVTLVADFQWGGKSLSYNQVTLDDFIRPKKWTDAEVALYLPEKLPAGSILKVYFYNPSRYYLYYVDDLRIDFVSLVEQPALTGLNGIIRAH